MTNSLVEQIEALKSPPENWTHYNDGWNKGLSKAIELIRSSHEPKVGETFPEGVLPDARLIRSTLFQQFMRQGFWHAHHVDLVWRMDGKDVREEADWLKDVWYALRASTPVEGASRDASSGTQAPPECTWCAAGVPLSADGLRHQSDLGVWGHCGKRTGVCGD